MSDLTPDLALKQMAAEAAEMCAAALKHMERERETPDLARLAAVAERGRTVHEPGDDCRACEFGMAFTPATCAWLVARVGELEKLLVEDFVDFMRCRFCWLTWNPGEPPTHDAKCAALAPPAMTGRT